VSIVIGGNTYIMSRKIQGNDEYSVHQTLSGGDTHKHTFIGQSVFSHLPSCFLSADAFGLVDVMGLLSFVITPERGH